MSMQRCGYEMVLKSIEDGEEISLILIKRDIQSAQISEILDHAEKLQIKVVYGSENDLWRMSKNNTNGIPDVLCLVGRNPDASIHQVLSKGGLIWLLAGASYPVNIGFCILPPWYSLGAPKPIYGIDGAKFVRHQLDYSVDMYSSMA